MYENCLYTIFLIFIIFLFVESWALIFLKQSLKVSFCPIFSSSSYIPNLSFTFYCTNAMFFNLIGLMKILFIVVVLVQHRRFELLDLSFEYCPLRVFSLFQRFLVIIYILFIRICRELLREKWLREERLQYRYLALFSIEKIPLYIRLLS